MFKKIVSAVFLSIVFMSMSLSAYADMPLYTIAASSVMDDELEQSEVVTPTNPDKEKSYTVEPSGSYMLTICSREQVQTAMAWQSLCVADRQRQFIKGMCPVMSYFRYCQPATSKEVKGLKPVKPNYTNVFLKE